MGTHVVIVIIIIRIAHGRWKQWVKALLLNQMLRNATHAVSHEFGVGFIGTNVKKRISGGDSNDNFIDLNGAWIGDTVNAFVVVGKGGFNGFYLLEKEGSNVNAFCGG